MTKQVENAVNGSAGLATLRSESIPGLSVVTITFADGIDVHVARRGISERLSELGSTLPAGVGTPKLSPLVSSTMDLLKIGLVSDKVDAYTLRDNADWIIKPRLLAVPGVARVNVFGGDVRQIQVLPDTRKLSRFNLSFSEVADAAKAALPLRGAGFIDLAAQRVLLKSPVPGPDIKATLSQAVIAVRNGDPRAVLRDVAEIKMSAEHLRFGDALVMDRHGVMISLSCQYGANTLSTTLAVEKALNDLEPALKKQGITLYRGLHRPANFIERALQDLRESLLIAAVLILAVLYLFLRDFRAALIAFTAIPLSLLAAVAVLRHMGLTLNTMTLGGFAVALGVLVDDAIIGRSKNILCAVPGNGRKCAAACNSKSAARHRPGSVARSAGSRHLRDRSGHRRLLTGVVHLERSRPLRRSLWRLPSFSRCVARSLIVAMATSTPAMCALLLRRHDARPQAALADAAQSLAEFGGAWCGCTYQSHFDPAGDIGHRRRRCPAVPGRHIHARFS